jgi:two-component system, NtrC family, sensor histidine kinase HydH
MAKRFIFIRMAFQRANIIRSSSLLGLLGVVALVHYRLEGVAPGWLHSLLGHLYIAPIIMAAYWYGFTGGVLVSIASSALFSRHLFIHWHMDEPFVDIYNYVEIFLFLLIGVTTGILSQMERNQRERYEQALVKLDESHRKLKEQTEVLFQTEEQLRRADRLSALGELSAGMAHEIRNPLGSIKGAAEILKDDYGPDTPKYEFIQILLKETDRLNQIVQEFLGFARPKPPELKQEDVNEIIESVLTLTAQPARAARVDVEKRLDQSIGKRDLDAGLLKQAFLNLVLNAIQAMPDGGTLTVASARNGNSIAVNISDTGTGISPENRKKLFSPFFTTKQDGTGLGLAITFRIIQNHRGTIDVDSIPGKGTTFTVRIPAS